MSIEDNDYFEYIVIGQGPIGALTALRLAQQTPTTQQPTPLVLAVEAHERAAHCDATRAFHAAHLSQRGVAALERSGVWHGVERRSRFVVRVAANGQCLLGVDGARGGVLVPQRHVDDALLRAVATHVAVALRFGWAFECVASAAGGALAVTLRQCATDARVTVRAGRLLACDGARSSVRRALGLSFDGATRHRWCVADIAIARGVDLVPDVIRCLLCCAPRTRDTLRLT